MGEISGFTVVKDAIKQGYPFVESIASALPICDEFLISDGYSTDGTYEILQKISQLNKKVKVFRDEWTKRGLTLITDISNNLRKKCKSPLLFYVQAPEIVHEDDAEMLKAVPELSPGADTFCLPYLSVIANSKIREEFRLRFCRNLSRINLTGDAWVFNASKEFIRSEAMRNMKRPKKTTQLRRKRSGMDLRVLSQQRQVTSAMSPQAGVQVPCPFQGKLHREMQGTRITS
jgi:glycosyltransferase involved in cell wall biosynthesis